MAKHAVGTLLGAPLNGIQPARARWLSAVALYLAQPVDKFSMIAPADQQALATVLRREDRCSMQAPHAARRSSSL